MHQQEELTSSEFPPIWKTHHQIPSKYQEFVLGKILEGGQKKREDLGVKSYNGRTIQIDAKLYFFREKRKGKQLWLPP